MARIRPEKEATLKEVLAEVSLLDVGHLLKQTFLTLGCLGVLYAIIFSGLSVAGNATGIAWSDFGIPSWVFWIILAWFYTYAVFSERSFHELDASWYFPKVGWFSSLLLAAYIVGFVYLNIPVFDMEYGVERLMAGLVIWLGYLGPFLVFFSAINIGHKKLMEKRAQPAADE